ncbi:MAG: peptidoglycan-binding protein [Candidatus Gracilibacteria bacterium]
MGIPQAPQLSNNTKAIQDVIVELDKISRPLEKGMSGNGVKSMQQGLGILGYVNKIPHGYFGPTTHEAVIKFQIDKGIIPNRQSGDAGIFGPRTKAKLKEALLAHASSVAPKKNVVAPLAPPIQKPTIDTRRAVSQVGTPKLNVPSSNLAMGASGDEVKALQACLATLGYFKKGPHGTFGPTTQESVIQFQLAKGIITSRQGHGAGVFGPQTRAKLMEVLKISSSTLTVAPPVTKPSKPAEKIPPNTTAKLATPPANIMSDPKTIQRIVTELDKITNSLAKWASGDGVKALQTGLAILGYFKKTAHGTLGPTTHEAMIQFQLAKGIITNRQSNGVGIFGPQTKAKLREELLGRISRPKKEEPKIVVTSPKPTVAAVITQVKSTVNQVTAPTVSTPPAKPVQNAAVASRTTRSTSPLPAGAIQKEVSVSRPVTPTPDQKTVVKKVDAPPPATVSPITKPATPEKGKMLSNDLVFQQLLEFFPDTKSHYRLRAHNLEKAPSFHRDLVEAMSCIVSYFPFWEQEPLLAHDSFHGFFWGILNRGLDLKQQYIAHQCDWTKLPSDLARVCKAIDFIARALHSGPKINSDDLIVGAHGGDVITLQTGLATLGYFKEEKCESFDFDTFNALVEFQIKAGVIRDRNDRMAGVFNAKTKTKLIEELSTFVQKASQAKKEPPPSEPEVTVVSEVISPSASNLTSPATQVPTSTSMILTEDRSVPQLPPSSLVPQGLSLDPRDLLPAGSANDLVSSKPNEPIVHVRPDLILQNIQAEIAVLRGQINNLLSEINDTNRKQANEDSELRTEFHRAKSNLSSAIADLDSFDSYLKDLQNARDKTASSLAQRKNERRDMPDLSQLESRRDAAWIASSELPFQDIKSPKSIFDRLFEEKKKDPVRVSITFEEKKRRQLVYKQLCDECTRVREQLEALEADISRLTALLASQNERLDEKNKGRQPKADLVEKCEGDYSEVELRHNKYFTNRETLYYANRRRELQTEIARKEARITSLEAQYDLIINKIT